MVMSIVLHMRETKKSPAWFQNQDRRIGALGSSFSLIIYSTAYMVLTSF